MTHRYETHIHSHGKVHQENWRQLVSVETGLQEHGGKAANAEEFPGRQQWVYRERSIDMPPAVWIQCGSCGRAIDDGAISTGEESQAAGKPEQYEQC